MNQRSADNWTDEQWIAYEAAKVEIQLEDLDLLLDGIKDLRRGARRNYSSFSDLCDKLGSVVQQEAQSITHSHRKVV